MIYPKIKQAFLIIKERIFEQESGEFMITIHDDSIELFAAFFNAELEWEEDGTKVCSISNLRMSDGNINLQCRHIDLLHAIKLLSELTRLKTDNGHIRVELIEQLEEFDELITELNS